MEDIVIGIDLGTTNSCVSYYFNKKVRTIENKDGDKVTPSYVYFQNLEPEKVYVGQHGKSMSSTQPSLGIYGVKRLVGRNFDDKYIKNNLQNLSYKVEADESNNTQIVLQQGNVTRKYSPKKIYTIILRRLKNDVEEKLNEEVTKVVITVPAHFNVAQREVTLAAAKDVGFNVLKLLNEPTAAALSYYHEFEDNDEENYCLIYDLGGGTFDVAILKKTKRNIKILGVDGDSKLGGQDFDDIILNYICEELEKNYNYNPKLDKNNYNLRRVRNSCEKAKKALSTHSCTPLNFTGLVQSDSMVEMNLTREKFEELADSLFQKTIDIMKNCLKTCGLDKKSIKEIILAGGSTRIPKIRKMISEYFDRKKLNNLVNPDECVAEGAALQAAMLSSNPGQKIEKIMLEDVVPLSLGIADFVDRMRFVIKRNSPIPVIRTDNYFTSESNQNAMLLRIYEGERLYAKKNRFLGDFTVSDISPAPRGECAVAVTMEVNENGILTVTAKEKFRDNMKELQVNCAKGTISEVDVEKSEEEDDLFSKFAEHKCHLLLYCDALLYNLQSKGLVDEYHQLWDICSVSKSEASDIEFPNTDKLKSMIEEIEEISKSVNVLKKFDRVPTRKFEL